jgi:hypothetical protein
MLTCQRSPLARTRMLACRRVNASPRAWHWVGAFILQYLKNVLNILE